jgi:hypothetical protein
MFDLDLGTAHGRLTQIDADDVSSSGGGHARRMTRPLAPCAWGARLVAAGIEFACVVLLRHESPLRSCAFTSEP